MTDEREKLNKTIQQLHTELASIENVDEEVQALLQSAVDEIQQAIQQPDPASPPDTTADDSSTISGRLSEAAQHFEESHPTLTGIIGSVIDSLSRMGI
ncbi:MAG: DUF4404 family protein [Pirellulales bacterium]